MRILKWTLVVLVVLLVAIQFVRPSMVNPPVDQTLALQSKASVPPQVDQILRRSCYDCHSYETKYPGYSKLAPSSWLLASDIKEGRNDLNFSDWGGYTKARQAKKLQSICEQVKEGDMPLWYYLPLHPTAKLSDADRQTLCTWSNALRGEVVASMTPAERAQTNEKRRSAEGEGKGD